MTFSILFKFFDINENHNRTAPAHAGALPDRLAPRAAYNRAAPFKGRSPHLSRDEIRRAVREMVG